MIQHVWERCCLAADKDPNVYIATDDERIRECSNGSIWCTSSNDQ